MKGVRIRLKSDENNRACKEESTGHQTFLRQNRAWSRAIRQQKEFSKKRPASVLSPLFPLSVRVKEDLVLWEDKLNRFVAEFLVYCRKGVSLLVAN